MTAAQPADLFVSAVEGHLCTRMGTVKTGRPVWIGCKRVAGKLVWDESEIVRIAAAEYREHRRTYDGAIRRGELKRRAEADFKAQAEKTEAAAKKQGEELAAKAEAAAKAASAETAASDAGGKGKKSKGEES